MLREKKYQVRTFVQDTGYCTGYRIILPVGYRKQDTGCRVQVAGYRMQDTGCKMQDAGYRIQDTGCRIT